VADTMQVTVSPHLHKRDETISRGMRDVLIALAPVTIWAIIVFGFNVVYIIAVSAITAALSEIVMRKIFRRPVTLNDYSAMVTALLFALILPPTTPLWVVAIGSFIAVAVAKELFGGLGKNIFNPAIFARVVLWFSPLALYTQRYVKPFFWKTTGFFSPVATSISEGTAGRVVYKTLAGHPTALVTAATPLSLFKNGRLLPGMVTGPTPVGATWLTSSGRPSFGSIFLGLKSGSIGEISILLLIIGGAYLIWRGTIDWRIPAGILGAFLVLVLVTWYHPIDQLFAGGLFLGAIFMATDWVTSPITRRGKWIYGIGIGVTIFILRFWGARPEAVAVSIFIWNPITLLIDRYIARPRFGEVDNPIFNQLPQIRQQAIKA
jgi:H+/Na+-translocating ferredoxin:NAD+ oxidoreductase subunit D